MDYRQVQNTSFIDNSAMQNNSFISQAPHNMNESRLESDMPPASLQTQGNYPPDSLQTQGNYPTQKRFSSVYNPQVNAQQPQNPAPNAYIAHLQRLNPDLQGAAAGRRGSVGERRGSVQAARRGSVLAQQKSLPKNTGMTAEAKKRENNREKQISTAKRGLKVIDCLAAFIAVSSGIIVYNENEVFYKVIEDDDGNIIKKSNESNGVCTALRFINVILTCCLCTLVLIHYMFTLKLKKLRRLCLQEDNLRTAGLLPKLVFELFICMIFCPPYVDYDFSGTVLLGRFTYSIDGIISIITLAKSYLVLKLYVHFSPWTSERAAKVCAKYKCQANVSFAIKAELKKRPYMMLGILMGVTIIYLGFAIRTFEAPYRDKNGDKPSFDFTYLANSFWLIIITMTTVGFGEGYPETHLGRTIGVISCIIGMLLVSLMVVSLTVASEFTAEESKAFYILKRIYANDNAKEKAANVIKTIFRLRKTLKSKNAKRIAEKFVMLTKLKKQISIFKNDYRIANAQNLPIDEMLKNLQEKLETDINDIKKEVMVIPDLDNRCNRLKERQGKISTQLDDVIRIQSAIADYMIKLHKVKNQR